MTQLESLPSVSATKLGRRRDPTRDADILEATLDVLAETGYEGMTIDMVATRARAGKATVYRRWDSKEALVIDAVACMKGAIDLDNLPDTGTLRGDLVALIKTPSIADAARKLKIMGGLVSLLERDPSLAEVAHQAITAPRIAVNRVLFERAMNRGEVRADADIDLISMVSSSMVSYRTLMLRKQVDRDYLISIIDGVILPALLKR